MKMDFTPGRYGKFEPPKRVRLNLLKRLNKLECSRESENRNPTNEIMKVQRERLKSRYHLQPHPYFSCNQSNIQSLVCEIDPAKPSVRKQVEEFVAKENSSTIMRGLGFLKQRFSDCLAPYNFDKYKQLSSEHFEIIKMSAGKYLHFGLRKNLQESSSSVISINIGIYLQNTTFKGATRPSYLTIYGHQIETNKSFVVGVYSGNFPIEIIGNEILQPLVAKILSLKENGIMIKNRSYELSLHSFICDPVSNSLITCTTMPNSMFGCSKCKVAGRLDVLQNQAIYPSARGDLRDDEDFKFCVVTEHHFATAVLQEVGIGLISQVCIDYQHFVCLGIMKTLIDLWINGDLKFRLNRDVIATINYELMELKTSCPSEFECHPKPIDEYKNWTSYDFRQFLLYYGPIVLRDNLTQRNYAHFLYLNIAMRIALDQANSEDINYYIIGQLLQSFVRDFTRIYGPGKVDYNVHNLLHIENVARKYKSLELIGGFQFHSTIQKTETLLKRRTFESGVTLDEIGKTIEQNNMCVVEKSKVPSVATNISTNMPDNFFLVSNGIVCIKLIGFTADGKLMLQGHRFLQSLPFTDIKTSSQNILAVRKLGGLEMWSPEQIISKVVVFRTEEGFYAMPLLGF